MQIGGDERVDAAGELVKRQEPLSGDDLGTHRVPEKVGMEHWWIVGHGYLLRRAEHPGCSARRRRCRCFFMLVDGRDTSVTVFGVL